MTVMVSHQLDDVYELSEHIWVVNKGKISASHSVDEYRFQQRHGDAHLQSSLPFVAQTWHENDQLMQLAMINNQRQLTEQQAWLPINQGLEKKTLWLNISAQDVVLAKQQMAGSSFQNCFAGKVIAIEELNQEILVSMEVNDHLLKAVISKRAQRQCQFTVGQSLFAYVKAMSLGFNQYRS